MRYTIISRCLGLLLLTAALLKGSGLGVDPVSRMGIFSAPAFQFLVVAFEVSLGFWLLSGKLPSGAWLTVLMAFAGFAVVSLYQGSIGQASCGCFGKLSVNPWYTFVIDIATVAALVFIRPDLQPLWENRARIGLTAACVFGGYVVLLGLLAGFVYFHFGSVSAALASLRGERLSVSPGLIDMGEGAPAETRAASVELTNRTEQPIRLIGGSADCSCTVLGDLPVTVPPGESRSITITMNLPKTPGMFNRKAQLTIDDDGFKTVGFRLTGRIKRSSE